MMHLVMLAVCHVIVFCIVIGNGSFHYSLTLDMGLVGPFLILLWHISYVGYDSRSGLLGL